MDRLTRWATMTQWTFPCSNPPSLSGGSRNETSSVAVAQKPRKWRERESNFFLFFSFVISPDQLFPFYEGPRFGDPAPGSQLDRGFATKIAHLDRP